MSDSEESSHEQEQKEEPHEEENVDNSRLKEKITAYIKIDDLIREKKEEIKELAEKRSTYEEFIKKYLEKENKTRIELNDGEIVFKKLSTRSPLKEELIEKAIVKKFQDNKKTNESGIKIAHDVIEEVNNLRGVSIKANIRRVKKKHSTPKSS